MKTRCIFDTRNFSSKPQGYEVGGIIKRMSIDQIKDYSVYEIKNKILEGYTIRPSVCDGKEDTWQSQQVFMIDIDNNLSINQAIDRCKEINLIPNFIYTSFSHTEEHHKFRLVFISDEPITNYDVAKKIQLYLMHSIGGVDEQCKNLNRIYYAGKDVVFESNSILESNKMTELSKDIDICANDKKKQSSTTKGEYNISNNNSSNILFTLSNNNENNYNLKALRDRDVEYLQRKLNNPPITFENDSEFWHYVFHNINMADLLELKFPKSFKCVLHNDDHPSASVFQNAEGVWLYKCHSNGCVKKAMNVKQLIEILGNFKSEHKAIKFLKDIYNLSIKETQWSVEQKANLNNILENLTLNKFAEICPQTSKNIRYVEDLFAVMVTIAKNYVYGENYMNTDGDAVFFISLSELAKFMKVSPTNHNRLSQRIAVLVYHDLIRKLDDDNIPEAMLKKAQALQIENGVEKRVNFYAIPSWVFQQLNTIEEQGIKWKNNGYTIKGTSYEMFYRGEGLEIAQRIYPQHKKITVEVDGEKKVIDRTTSDKSDVRTNYIVEAIHIIIKEQGYATEKAIVKHLDDKYKYITTEIQIKKSLLEILDNYDLQRIRANKEIKEQYNMDTTGHPFIIVKK